MRAGDAEVGDVMVVAGPRRVEGVVVGERVRGGVGSGFVLGHVGGLDGLRGVAVVAVERTQFAPDARNNRLTSQIRRATRRQRQYA